MSGAFSDARDRPVLVTGGAGFIGCNLADRLAAAGRTVRVLDSLARPGVEANLDWLLSRHGERIQPHIKDVRDKAAVDEVCAGVGAVFHLAAQVAVTTSMIRPVEDFEINVGGGLNVLEAVRRSGEEIPVIFASTNKVYGDLADIPLELCGGAYLPQDQAIRLRGIGEDRRLDFHTPYGCSKGAADQYVLDYARSFGVPTCVLRMSCIYGPRQLGTEDQGWVAHFLIRALQGQSITLYGDGRQVRDILHVQNAVDAYVCALAHINRVSGRAFNLGGGPDNAVSLRALLGYLEETLGRKLDIQFQDWRPGDQKYFVADASSARADLGLPPFRAWREGVSDLARWLQAQAGPGSSEAREAAA